MFRYMCMCSAKEELAYNSRDETKNAAEFHCTLILLDPCVTRNYRTAYICESTCWIDVLHFILILLLSLCLGIAQTPIKCVCFCLYIALLVCCQDYMWLLITYIDLRSIWSSFCFLSSSVRMCECESASKQANERVHNTDTHFSVDLFRSEKRLRGRKNELTIKTNCFPRHVICRLV